MADAITISPNTSRPTLPQFVDKPVALPRPSLATPFDVLVRNRGVSVNPGAQNCGLVGDLTDSEASLTINGTFETLATGDFNGDGFLDLVIGDASYTATYSDADSFKVYPTDFRFIQAAAGYPGTVTSNPEYTSACTYTVGNADANLGFYAIQLLDAAGNAIALVDHQSDDDKDFFTVNVKAVTGKNSASPLAVTGEPQDSSKVPSTGNFAALGKANLVVTLKGNDMTSTTDGSDTADVVLAADEEDIVKMNAKVGGKHSMRFQLNVALLLDE